MAIDIIARGLASSLIGSDGKISSDKMPTIGTAPSGATFYPIGALTDPSALEGKTVEEILLMMFYGVTNPTFVNPSLTIDLGDLDTLIVGKPTTISGKMVFNRGSITPPYGTSGYRAGEATEYLVNGAPTAANFSLEVTPAAGDNIITCEVKYAQGEQPFNSAGQAYDKPLPAGSVIAVARLQAVNQIYTGENLDSTLDFSWFEEEDGSGEGYQALIATETATTKQSFAIAASVKVVGIKQFEPMTQTWMWIGGSAATSLTYFDTTRISGDTLGENEDYILYTHNGSLTGQRELRIYVE